MNIFQTATVVLVVLISVVCNFVCGGTFEEQLQTFRRGNGSILSGVISNRLDLIRQGLSEGGNVNAVLDPFLGEVVLKIGRAFIDFPVAPAIHVAIYRVASLELALLLLRNDADIDSFTLPHSGSSNRKESSSTYVSPRGYPPALIFAIGGVDRPTSNAHAALVKQLHERYPHAFNRSRLQQWVEESHSPPILHLTIIARNFDMTYVMVSEFSEHLRDDRDIAGLSALHVAAWLNDIPTLVLLLFNGMDIMARDNYGRLPIHYAAMRGLNDVVNLLLIDTKETPAAQISSWKRSGDPRDNRRLRDLVPVKQLLSRDSDGATPLDLVSDRPRLESTYVLLTTTMELYGLPIDSTTVELKQTSSPTPSSVDDEEFHHWRRCTFVDYPTFQSSREAARYGIDQWDSTHLSSNTFRRNYFQRQRPVQIVNQLNAGQKIWAFRDKPFFLQRYGSLQVTSMPLKGESSESFGILEFVSQCMSDIKEDKYDSDIRGSSKRYICPFPVLTDTTTVCTGNTSEPIQSESVNNTSVSSKLPSHICSYAAHGRLVDFSEESDLIPGLFTDDLVQSPLFDLCRDRVKEPIEFIIGSVDTGIVPLQKSRTTWNMVLVGTIHWLLVSPGHADVLHSTEEELIAQYKSKYANFSASEWLDQLQIRLIQQNITFSWTTTRVGDVLFIPNDWSYASLHLSDSVALRQNFCTFIQSSYLWQQLGPTIYGAATNINREKT